MTEQLTAEHAIADPIVPKADAMPRARLHRRVRHGVKQPHNWFQLIKFGAVGASGYAVNLAVYEVARGRLDVHYLIAAVIAFCFAVTNNFLLNRYWTFKAREGHAGFQAARFLVVSLLALAFNLVVLKVLVTAGVGEFPAQAVAIVCATPLNFVGNKLWSFGR
ncbi:MAG: GtrA family protein [Actinobacteria bacterium]|nr:GtrA family protein [Actinomycetota bacterium]